MQLQGLQHRRRQSALPRNNGHSMYVHTVRDGLVYIFKRELLYFGHHHPQTLYIQYHILQYRALRETITNALGPGMSVVVLSYPWNDVPDARRAPCKPGAMPGNSQTFGLSLPCPCPALPYLQYSLQTLPYTPYSPIQIRPTSAAEISPNLTLSISSRRHRCATWPPSFASDLVQHNPSPVNTPSWHSSIACMHRTVPDTEHL